MPLSNCVTVGPRSEVNAGLVVSSFGFLPKISTTVENTVEIRYSDDFIWSRPALEVPLCSSVEWSSTDHFRLILHGVLFIYFVLI
jgi:hypothetical protein